MVHSCQVLLSVTTTPVYVAYKKTCQMLLPEQCSTVNHSCIMSADVKKKQEIGVTSSVVHATKTKPALPAKPECIGELVYKRPPNVPSPNRGHTRSPSDGSYVKIQPTKNTFEGNYSKSELDLKHAGNENPSERILTIAERTKLFEENCSAGNLVKNTTPVPAPRPLSQNFDNSSPIIVPRPLSQNLENSPIPAPRPLSQNLDSSSIPVPRPRSQSNENPPAVQESKKSSNDSKLENVDTPSPALRQINSIAHMAKMFESKLSLEQSDDSKRKVECQENLLQVSGGDSINNLDQSIGATSDNKSVDKLETTKKVGSFNKKIEKTESDLNSNLQVPKGPPPPKPPRTYAHDIYLWVKARSQNKKPLTVVPETPENAALLYQTVIPRSQRPPKEKDIEEINETEKIQLQILLDEICSYSSENEKSHNDESLNKVDFTALHGTIAKPPRKSLILNQIKSKTPPALPPRPVSPVKHLGQMKSTPPRPPPPAKSNIKSDDCNSYSSIRKGAWPFECFSGALEDKHIYDSVPEENSKFFIALNCNLPTSPTRECNSLKRSYSEEHIYAEPEHKKFNGNSNEDKPCHASAEEKVELTVGVSPYMTSPVKIRPRSRSLHDTSRNASLSPPRDRHKADSPQQEPIRTFRHKGFINVMDKVNQAFAMMKKRLSSDSSAFDLETKDKEIDDQEGDSDVEVSPKDVQERITYMRFIKENHYSNVEIENELYMRSYPRLFELVVLVGLKINDEFKKYEPYIKMRFPPEATSCHDREVIPQFCFPDASSWQPVTVYHSETYYFVLTNETGIKTFGYCRRVLSAGSGPRLPLVYCVISPVRAVHFYTQFLNELVKRHHMCDSAVIVFLQASYVHHLPSCGKTLSIRTTTNNGNSVVTLARLSDPKRENFGVGCLLKLLDIANLLKVFGSLLLERRVIFASPSLSALSQCIHSLTSLLYPFSWQHTFIPVLPDTLLDICQSPIPYIIGVKSNCLAQITEQVLIVDLEHSQLKQEFGDESVILPNRIRKSLTTALNMSKGVPEATKEEIIAEAFLRVFVEMVGHYGEHIVTHTDGKRKFQKETFCQSVRSKNLSLFLQWFTETQMFQVFIEEKLTDVQKGLFEERIIQYQESSSFNLKGNVKEIGRKVKNFGERLKKAF